MYTDKLSGKTFVVIGASSGIGRALASALLVVGAKKVHIASSNADRINKAVETVRKEAIEEGGAKGEIVGSVIDLKSEEKVKEWFDNVGKFDHLVITYVLRVSLYMTAKEKHSLNTPSLTSLHFFTGLASICRTYLKPFI